VTPAKKDRTELFGWIGIVVGFICCPIVGLILGALSIRDAKASGKSPVLGYIAIAASLVSAIVGGIWALNRN
jgi:hypothetical protein